MNPRNVLLQISKGTALIVAAALILGSVSVVLAQTTADEEFDELQNEVDDRKAEVEQINKQLDSHRAKLNQYSSETAGLYNDIAMIENHIAIAELDVAVAQIEIETQQLELQILEAQIDEEAERLNTQRDMLGEMVFALHRRSDIGLIEVLFGANDFNALFTEVEQLESINSDLNSALGATQETKATLEDNRRQQEIRLDDLVALEKELNVKISQLEQQQGAKSALLDASQESETKYLVLMSELRQERQFVANEVARLQSEIDNRIIESDEVGGEPGVMSWPVTGGIITATYHDPSYPFRHLFEHSGLDIAAPTGTQVRSSAPGIVAWARTGRSYGNYIMIVHSGGYATLYAHLSSMDVSADQFVSRGQQIGRVGNTGLSTGPHLHYEVRLNGIPVNPQTYLVGN